MNTTDQELSAACFDLIQWAQGDKYGDVRFMQGRAYVVSGEYLNGGFCLKSSMEPKLLRTLLNFIKRCNADKSALDKLPKGIVQIW